MSPKILVVEDDKKLVELIAHYLHLRGYEAVIALDGLTALELAASERPDLIVMDLRLPKLHGLDLLRQLRAAPSTEDIPIVVLTAQSSYQIKESAMAAGCTDFLVKPIPLSLLARRVETLLGNHSAPVAV